MLLAVYYRGLMHLENLKTEPIRGYLPVISTKLSNNKLSDNNLASELVKNRSFLN